MDDPLIGTKINRYEILDCLDRTEFVGIYKVFDTKLERNALMKLVSHSADYSKDFVEYFLSESRTLAKISHPNIARILDFGYDHGNLYLISEYLSGQTLADRMTGPIPWQQVTELLIPVAEALSYAHSQGIIHRDLKPENITLTEDNRPILSDFSLLRMIESEETRDMTGTNVGLGSPAYISPEQGKGLTVDFRSDIYSLGIIFFEMITGQKPFSAGTSMEIVIQHVTAPPPSPRSIIPDLPLFVEEIVLKSLSKDVDKRYQSMEEFSKALRSVLLLVDQPNKNSEFGTRNRIMMGASALVVAIIVLSAVSVWRKPAATSVTATESPISVTEMIHSPTPEAEKTAITATVEATILATEPPTISTFPESAFSLPSLPVLPGVDVPAASAVINKVNASSLVELARWGNPNIYQFAFIENDQALLSGTSAGVYYFDPSGLNPKHFFDAAGSISALSVSSDGKWVATGDSVGNIHVWNIANGKEIVHFQKDSQPIKSIDFSPDNLMLVSNAVGKIARIWSIPQKSELVTLQGQGLNINKVLFSPKGDTVITGGEDFKILIWDVASGKILKKYTAAKKINDMSLSSDGNILAVALNNATIEIWDLRAGTLINTLKNSKIVASYSFVKFLPNDQLILTGSEDGLVRVWNIQASDILWQTTYQNSTGKTSKPAAVKSIAVSNNGTKFITLFEDKHVELWNLSNQKLEISKALNYEPVQRVALSPDRHIIAYQGGNSFVGIWSLPGAKQIAQIDGRLPRGSPFSNDSQLLLIESNNLDLYSLTGATPALLFSYLGFPIDGSVIYLQDDRMIAGASNGVVKYWSISSGDELQPSALKPESNCRVIYGRAGGFLAAGSINGIINNDANSRYFCLIPRGARTTSESYLPDGSIVALSQENQTVEIWNLHSGNQKSTIKSEPPGDMLGVAISNDGTLLAAASANGTVEIYDLETMKLVSKLDIHTGPVNQVLFSYDGKYIITGLADGTIRFFGLYP